MIRYRFTHFASVIFGIFALYTAFRAMRHMYWFPRDFGSDSIRLCSILIAIVFGLALIQPDRFLPALRRIAQQITPGPVRFLCALAMIDCLLVARLSGATTFWISIALAVGFVVAFICPGFVYQNLRFTPSEKITMREHGKTVGKKLRDGPKSRQILFLVSVGLLILGAVGVIIHLGVIPNPMLASVSGWIGFMGAGLITVGIFYPYFLFLPRSSWAGSLPGLALMALTSLGISTYGNRAILLEMLPTGAAYFWGKEASQNVVVIKSMPSKRRKGCNGLLVIQTAAGKQEICNLSREFLEELSPGNTLVITGKATYLGQTIRYLRLVD